MNINFTIEQQAQALRGIGYTVESVDAFISCSEYHNKTSFQDVKILIAYKGNLIISKEEFYITKAQYGVEVVFERELKQRILEKLF